jgi:hypothetical protein
MGYFKHPVTPRMETLPFDSVSNTSTTSNSADQMEEYGVPIAPPSPTMVRRVLILLPCDIPKVQELLKPIQSHEAKCAICRLNCSIRTVRARVQHMNQCRDKLCQRAHDHLILKTNLVSLLSGPRSISGESEEDGNDVSESSSTASFSDSLLPTTLHLSTPPASQTPRTSCLICAISLTHLDAIASFTYRACCIASHRPVFCPICFANFLHQFVWDRPDIAWHLHNCHNSGRLSQIEKDSFEALAAAWSGRMKVLDHALMRRAGEGSRTMSSYKAKKEDGFCKGHGTYWSGETGLRSCRRVLHEQEMKVTAS